MDLKGLLLKEGKGRREKGKEGAVWEKGRAQQGRGGEKRGEERKGKERGRSGKGEGKGEGKGNGFTGTSFSLLRTLVSACLLDTHLV